MRDISVSEPDNQKETTADLQIRTHSQ